MLSLEMYKLYEIKVMMAGSWKSRKVTLVESAATMLTGSAIIGGLVGGEGEEVRLRRRAQLYIGEALDSTGELIVTTRRVAWQPEGSAAAQGFSLFYQAIVMHAVSRDTNSFHSPCLYLQLDAEHKVAGSGSLTAAAAAPNGNGATAPMDVCDPQAANGNGAAAGATDCSDEEEDDEDEDENEAQELRVVPLGAEADGAGIDAALDRLFEALSACAALNPDPDDSEDDDETFAGEEGEEGEEYADGAVVGIDGFAEGDDPQALLDGASPAQLAMLARFDAMLDASGNPVDGRFDDPDDEEQQLNGAPQPPAP